MSFLPAFLIIRQIVLCGRDKVCRICCAAAFHQIRGAMTARTAAARWLSDAAPDAEEILIIALKAYIC